MGRAFDAGLHNFALRSSGAVATQSSLSGNGLAERAIDGSTDGAYNHNSVTHTKEGDQQPWWQVDLGKRVRLDEIRTYNRTDSCCAGRLSHFHVLVSNQPLGANERIALSDPRIVWQGSYEATAGALTTFATPPIQGRYVRVQLEGPGILSLAEVQVRGVNIAAEYAEYADPWQINEEPDGYQERLRTLYIASVESIAPSGRLMGRSQLTYDFLIGSGQDAHMAKRILTDVDYLSFNSSGNFVKAAPSMKFAYWGGDSNDKVTITRDGGPGQCGDEECSEFSDENGALYGAVKAVTSPTGDVTSYTYRKVDIDIRREVKLPDEANGRRVLFGTDYAIVVTGGGGSIYYWTDRGWLTTDSSISLSDIHCPEIDSSCSSIVAERDYVAVRSSSDPSTFLYIPRNKDQPGFQAEVVVPADGEISRIAGNSQFIATLSNDGRLNIFKVGSLTRINNPPSFPISAEKIRSIDVGRDYLSAQISNGIEDLEKSIFQHMTIRLAHFRMALDLEKIIPI